MEQNGRGRYPFRLRAQMRTASRVPHPEPAVGGQLDPTDQFGTRFGSSAPVFALQNQGLGNLRHLVLRGGKMPFRRKSHREIHQNGRREVVKRQKTKQNGPLQPFEQSGLGQKVLRIFFLLKNLNSPFFRFCSTKESPSGGEKLLRLLKKGSEPPVQKADEEPKKGPDISSVTEFFAQASQQEQHLPPQPCRVDPAALVRPVLGPVPAGILPIMQGVPPGMTLLPQQPGVPPMLVPIIRPPVIPVSVYSQLAVKAIFI